MIVMTRLRGLDGLAAALRRDLARRALHRRDLRHREARHRDEVHDDAIRRAAAGGGDDGSCRTEDPS